MARGIKSHPNIICSLRQIGATMPKHVLKSSGVALVRRVAGLANERERLRYEWTSESGVAATQDAWCFGKT